MRPLPDEASVVGPDSSPRAFELGVSFEVTSSVFTLTGMSLKLTDGSSGCF